MGVYFTPQDVNRILPEIQRQFSQIIARRNRVISLQEELQNLMNQGLGFEPFVSKKQELNKAVSLLYKKIEDFESQGLMIKSVDDGLVDFPSLRFEEEVWLCWKYGESEIKFWHGRDEGFMGRKPLASASIIEP
ncbi:MAG: DUF2203 domain-containing protein [Candidatus Eiseniibacteriota bacterium]|jgi:hypothetical protein